MKEEHTKYKRIIEMDPWTLKGTLPYQVITEGTELNLVDVFNQHKYENMNEMLI